MPVEGFDCSSCDDDARRDLGHDAPAEHPVVWDAPDGFYLDRRERGKPVERDPDRFRCPKLHVTPWAYAVLDQHQALMHLGVTPLPGGTALWPAKLRAALLFLEGQYAARRSKIKKDAADEADHRARLSRARGFTAG